MHIIYENDNVFPYYVSEKKWKLEEKQFSSFSFFLPFCHSLLLGNSRETMINLRDREKIWENEATQAEHGVKHFFSYEDMYIIPKDRNLDKNEEQKAKEVARNWWITILEETSGQLDTKTGILDEMWCFERLGKGWVWASAFA